MRFPVPQHTVSRRQLLSGTLGALGVSACGQPLLAEELTQRRKKLLLLFQSGGASQYETWDPKQGTHTGGPFQSIPTSVPGVHISELLPHSAEILDQLTVIRSINSGINDHFFGHYAIQAGHNLPGHPVLGSVVAQQLEQSQDILPGYISLRRDGPKAYTDVGDAGFLGAKYEGLRVINAEPPEYLVRPESVSALLMQSRDQIRRRNDERFLQGRRPGPIHAYRDTFDKAFALMTQRDLFNLEQESARDRERYGEHDFGRHCLLARRLLEAGVSCVKVTHHDWDAHQENFHWHEVRCGEFDRTFATLVRDFSERGLLEDTLIVAIGEMGRTPRINQQGGRDHWGKAWSMAMAGCGIRPCIHGSTNEDGTEVADGEVNHGDLFHTFLTALGIDANENYQLSGQTSPIGDPACTAIAEVLA